MEKIQIANVGGNTYLHFAVWLIIVSDVLLFLFTLFVTKKNFKQIKQKFKNCNINNFCVVYDKYQQYVKNVFNS